MVRSSIYLFLLILASPAVASDVPRFISCDAEVERTCTAGGCTELQDPPMELTVDLLEGVGNFCLYTFCGEMDGELSSQGGGVLNGPLVVIATINDETGLMRYQASFDAKKLTFSVFTASGDEVTAYAGTCEPRESLDAEQY